jgi:hypothetical protein
MLATALVLLVLSALLAGVLASRISASDRELHERLGQPLTYEWYPFWVLELLRNSQWKALGLADRLVAAAAGMGLCVGILLFAIWSIQALFTD